MRRAGLATKILAAVAGSTIAVMLAVYGGLFVRSMFRHPTLEQLTALLFLWQTQTGAMIALVAAVIGAAVVLHQTGTTRRQAETRLMRRAEALRAVLPLALAELSDYTASCAAIYAGLLAQPNSLPITTADLHFPPLPAGLADHLTQLIEVSDPAHAMALITLARRVQIHHSRAEDAAMRLGNRNGLIFVRANVVSNLIGAAEIYARCNGLFVYARGAAEDPVSETSPGDVKTALRLMPDCVPHFDELAREIDRLAARPDGGRWLEV